MKSNIYYYSNHPQSQSSPDGYQTRNPYSGPRNVHQQGRAPYQPARRVHRRKPRCGCCLFNALIGIILTILLLYFFVPLRTNFLLLGIDYADPGSYVARTDTIILTTIVPLEPYVGMLSIPRDLWLTIPGIGENRINTAHFYAEAQNPGSGPQAVIATIEQNFGVRAHYYARLRFEGFREIVDAMGGVVIELSDPMAGYPAGKHLLTGNKALAFVRSREWSDDFSRMQQAQFMLRTLMKNALMLENWQKAPDIFRAGIQTIDTDLPIWLWPRLTLAILRAGPRGFDSRSIDRQMVTPFTTSGGANVLAPNWPLINPLLEEMFK